MANFEQALRKLVDNHLPVNIELQDIDIVDTVETKQRVDLLYLTLIQTTADIKLQVEDEYFIAVGVPLQLISKQTLESPTTVFKEAGQENFVYVEFNNNSAKGDSRLFHEIKVGSVDISDCYMENNDDIEGYISQIESEHGSVQQAVKRQIMEYGLFESLFDPDGFDCYLGNIKTTVPMHKAPRIMQTGNE